MECLISAFSSAGMANWSLFTKPFLIMVVFTEKKVYKHPGAMCWLVYTHSKVRFMIFELIIKSLMRGNQNSLTF